MPRLYIGGADEASEKALGDFCERTGNGSSNFDLCCSCAKDWDGIGELPSECGPYNGEPEGEGIQYQLVGDDGAAHPCYEDEEYDCEVCGKRLTKEDN